MAIARARRAAVALAVLTLFAGAIGGIGTIGATALAPTAWAQTDPTTSTLPPESTTTDPTASTTTATTLTTDPGPTPTPTLPAPTTAPPAESTTTTVPLPEEPDDPNLAGISPELADVPIIDIDVQTADAALAETIAAQAAARLARAAAEARIVELTAEETGLRAVIAAETDHRIRADRAVDDTRADLRDIAVARYIHGATSDLVSVELNDLHRGTEAAGRRVIFHQVSDARIRSVATALDDLDAAETALARAEASLASVRQGLAQSVVDQERAAADEARLTDALQTRRLEAGRARALAIVAGTDLPLVALDAYWRAQQVLALERPDCGITWWALAGIGRSESNHGRYGLSLIEPDGETSIRIIGIPLDGTRGTRLITDTDAGLLDGDISYDRAVGPMQFIPGTWRRNGRDGNGDGIADPHNLYDAALASANMLCGGGPMNTEAHMLAGFFRYNRSVAYTERVLARAYGYQLATQSVPVLAAPLLPAAPGG